MEKRRKYSEARLNVVRLSGKSVLLAGSGTPQTNGTLSGSVARTDYVFNNWQ